LEASTALDDEPGLHRKSTELSESESALATIILAAAAKYNDGRDTFKNCIEPPESESESATTIGEFKASATPDDWAGINLLSKSGEQGRR
jgi:hypothetical protein